VIKFIIILFFFLSTCSYPDIDSVPDFNNMKLTNEESIDLCKITNSDNEQMTSCLEKTNQSID